MDVPEVSSDLPGDSGPREAGALGTGGWDVGGTGFEYAGRRIAGAPAADRQKILPREIWRGRAHRLESGFLWLQLAAAANLQKIGRGLFCDAENGVERYQSAAFQLFWWQSPDGSKVLSYFPHDYARGIEPEPLAEDVARARQLDPGLPGMMHLFGGGDHA